MTRRFSVQPVKPVETPEIDPDALREFTSGAKDRRDKVMPWDKHDPESKPIRNTSLRLNEHYMEKLAYLAQKQDTSQHKVLMRLLLPAIDAEVEKLMQS